MARRKRNLLDYVRLPDFDLDSETKKGVLIIFLLALGAIGFLGIFDLAGELGQYLKQGLTIAFGWSKWLLPVILIAWGYALYKDDEYEIKLSNYFGLIVFILSLPTLLFLFINQDKWPIALSAGAGGGYVGWWFAQILIKYTGLIVAFILDIALLIISLILIFNTSLKGLFGPDSIMAKIFSPVVYLFGKLFRRGARDDEEVEEDPSASSGQEEDEESEEEEEDEESEEEEEDEEDEEEVEDEEIDDAEKLFSKTPVKNGIESSVWWQPTGLDINLPLNLLDGMRGKPTSGDIKESQEIIKRTLMNFGIPAEMGTISVGPTVTQYTFKPAEGIKLSRITNLSNDFALALAMHPIRIEAPIPGKSLVGVEVPNQSKAVVSLKEVLSTDDFKNRKSNLTIALGKDVAGKNWVDDIAKMPHLLVAGATNSGKSVCLNSIIVSLLYENNPDDLRLIMVDPKRVELQLYNGIPHLLTPVITDVGQTINALKWCLNEMDRRFDIISHTGKRDIKGYNEGSKVPMPHIIFIIDELADLMVAAGRDIEAGVIRLSQMARAVGIHLILATQRPSVNIITGVIKANMPARVAFSVASSTDSRTILDTMGAEKLLGRGDMLYTNSEMSKPRRLQGAFVSDTEIKRIVRYIKDKSNKRTLYLENVVNKQKVRGIGGYGLNGGGDDMDEMFEEAREVVINSGKASASFLQRKLRIGYARAASLLDAMEEAGIVGQGSGAKPREILISREQYAAVTGMGTSGVSLHRREDAEAPDEYLEDDEDDESDIPPIFKDEEDEDKEFKSKSAAGGKSEDDKDGGGDVEEENEDEDNGDDNKDEDESEDLGQDEDDDSAEDEKEEEIKVEPTQPKKDKNIDFNKFFSR